MSTPIDELVRRRVIEKWINGFPRDKIVSNNSGKTFGEKIILSNK
jgi:hypothetical protein